MLEKKHNFVSIAQYAEDAGKTTTIVSRYINKGRPLPGIIKVYQLGPRVFVLEKGVDYKAATARLRKTHYLSENPYRE